MCYSMHAVESVQAYNQRTEQLANLTQQWPPAVLPQTWPNSDLLLFSHKPNPTATSCCSPTNLTQQQPSAVLPQTWPNGDFLFPPQTWPNSHLLQFSYKPDPMVTSCCSPTNLTQQPPLAVLPQRRCLKKFWQVNDLCKRGKQTQTAGTHMRGTVLPAPTTSAQ